MKKSRFALPHVSIAVLITIFLFIGCILLFSAIVDENILEKNYDFDTAVVKLVTANVTPRLQNAMSIITFFGSSKFLMPAYIVLILYLLWKKKKAIALDISIIAISSTMVMFALKEFFHRNRPDSTLGNTLESYSFPSGHTVSSFVFCSVLAYLVWKTDISALKKYSITIILFFCTIAVGISRIILLAHFATDVIAAYCFAFAWTLMSFWLIQFIRKKLLHRSITKI